MEGVSSKRIEELFSDMRRKYIEDRERLREKLAKEGKKLLFVHELCECTEKRKMRLRFPDIERATAYNPRFALGQLVEEALKHRFQNEGENIYMKELKMNDGSYVISGMIDIIDLETKTPIEIKYQTSLQKSPQEHHILQVKAYLWLLNTKQGEIVYVSPEGIKTYIVSEPLTDEEVKALIKDGKAPRWIEWECFYCPYQQFCNKSDCGYRKTK
jgi:CRISPR/Cas system-associated exonuclease Cas4 (RecB family)